MYHLYICVYFPHKDQLGRTHFPHNILSPQCIICTYVCIFPTTPTRTHTFSPQCTFPTMYHLYVCVYVPHNDQLGRTHFPHNVSFVRMCVFSPQRQLGRTDFLHNVSFVRMCVFSPQRQLGRTDFPHNHFPHNISFVRMCVFSPQRQLGRTHFPHNALSPQRIVDMYRWVCACPSHFLSTRLQVRPFNGFLQLIV